MTAAVVNCEGDGRHGKNGKRLSLPRLPFHSTEFHDSNRPDRVINVHKDYGDADNTTRNPMALSLLTGVALDRAAERQTLAVLYQ